MRDSLTVLAIVLICLLSAALVAPYFIDWTAHRSLIEAKLSDAAGTRVAIAGPIRVRLLPQPKFRIEQVTIGDAAAGQQSFTAEGLDVDIALTALMQGNLQVGNAVLHAPRLDLKADPDGVFRLGRPGSGDARRVRLDHVAVRDGTLTLARPGRSTITLSNLDVDGEAASLLGPYKATGRFGPLDDPKAFKLSTGAFEAGKLRVKLAFERSRSLPAAEFDGTAVPGGGTARAPKGPSFAGLLTLKGVVPLDGTPATIPWVLTGHVEAGDDRVTSGDVEIRAGTDMRAVSATGSGELSLGATPHARLRLRGPQANLDRLAVAPEKSSLAPPAGIELPARLNRRLGELGLSGLPPVDIDFALDTVTTGPVTVLGVTGQIGLDGGDAARVRLTANGPDAARASLDGTLEAGTAPVFRGRIEAGARDLPRIADWLAPLFPEASAWVKATIPARAVGFAGTVDLSGVGLAARDAVIHLDRTTVAGTLTLTRAVGGDRARVFADLTCEGLDIDDLPDLGSAANRWADTDLDLAVAARAVKMVPAGVGAVDAGQLGLRLHRTGERAVLDALSAELGSARLTATGTLDGSVGTFDAHVDAPQLDAIAGVLSHLLPGRATAWLDARAPALSPARLDIGLKAARAGDGTLLPTALTLDGTMNGSRIKAGLDPDTPGELDPSTTLFSVDLEAEAPQGAILLRQLGLPDAAGRTAARFGAGRLKGKAHGSAAEGFVASVDASLGGAVLSFQGRARPDRGNGHLTLQGSDLAPLLRAGGIDLGEEEAAWPAAAEADVIWHDATLAFRRLRGRGGGVAVGGDLDAMLSPPAGGAGDRPLLFGSLTLDRLSLPAVLDVALGPASREAAGLAPPRETGAPGVTPPPWSRRPFGPPLLQWPRTEVAIKVKSLTARDGLEVKDASLIFRAAKGAVTLADVIGKVGDGNLGGSLTMRRDGDGGAINGTVSWSGIGLDWPGLSGRSGGAFEFGASGSSPAALVANLAGTGSLTLADGRVARLDPGALARAALKAERNTSDIDAEEITGSLVPDLDRAPLRLGDVSGQGSLATGVLRLGPMRAARDGWSAETAVAIDLKDFGFSSKTLLRVEQPLPDWKGDPPQVTLLLDGPIAAPRREIEAAAFVNALQARAIARDQERIDTMQQDIRERAFFNRRLKAIEAEQAAARDRARAEAEVLRQNRPGLDAPPGPPSRPATLPGGRLPGAEPRRNRTSGSKPAPAGAAAPPPPEALDPSSAGRY